MISETTVAKLGGAVDVRELDRIAVKGKDLPVTVFEVLDEVGVTDPSWIARARRFEEGLAKYRAMDFKGAIEIFESNSGDEPSEIFAARCKHFLEEPPPDNWNGVWVMKEK
jgi:adenylate cyclase